EVTRSADRSDAAELRELQAYGVARLAPALERGQVGEALVEDERPPRAPPHLRALLDRRARLLDVDVMVGDRGDEARRLGLRPESVRVDDHALGLAEHLEAALDALDVLAPAGADLQLELPVAGRERLLRPAAHLAGRRDPDPGVERELLLEGAAEQVGDAQPGRLAEQVPAGDVDRRLRVRMALDGRVHAGVDDVDLARIGAQHG